MHPRYTEDDLKVLLGNMNKVGGGESRAVKRQVSDACHQAVNHPIAVPKGNMLCAPSPKKREFDSKWEETYASELVLRKHAGLIRNYWYHPFSMWLPGKVRYTPDFMIQYPDGLEQRMEIIDVKGWHKNIRAAMVAIRVGAGVFPCFTWKLAKKTKGGGWSETLVEA